MSPKPIELPEDLRQEILAVLEGVIPLTEVVCQGIVPLTHCGNICNELHKAEMLKASAVSLLGKITKSSVVKS